MRKPLHAHFSQQTCLLVASLILPFASAFGQGSVLSESRQAFYRGDYAEAAELARVQLRKFPADVPVRMILARTELALGNFDEAFENIRKVLALDPKNIDALYYLSLLAKELAQRENQRLLSIAPDSYRVHQLLGAAALMAGNPGVAESEFLQALRINPRSVDVLTALGDLKRSERKFEEAISYYAQAAHSGTLSYEIAYGLGICFSSMTKYPEAIDWFQKAVALAPDSAAGRFALGNALFHKGDFAPAIAELKATLQIDPGMRQAYLLLVRAYSNLGRPAEAKAALQKVGELDRAELGGKHKSSGVSHPKRP
jgi:tetratricopeptide (TPR) repeat protein